MDENRNEQDPGAPGKTPRSTSFESLDILIRRWKDGTFGEILDDWRWIFSYSRRYKGAIIFYTLLGILSTTLGLVSSVASKYLIDIITGYRTEKLALLIAMMVGSTVFSLVFSNLIGRVSLKMGIDIGNDIQAEIFDKIIDADWLALNKYRSGDILHRFNTDISTIGNNAVNWLPTIIIAFYHFIAAFLLIMHYNGVMAVLAFAGAPFMLLMSRFIVKKQREYGKNVRKMNSDMVAFEVETFYNLDTIKSFGIAGQFGRKMRMWQQNFKNLRLEYNLFQIKTNVFLSLLNSAIQMIAFLYCLYLLWTHAITYGTMMLFLQQRASLSGAFNNVIGIVPSFLNSSISAHRIRELVELPREKHIPSSSAFDAFRREGFCVEMTGVDFAYVQNREVITHSDFIARPGEIVALIGPSGEGKTTLIRLILGLVSPEKGSVRIIPAANPSVSIEASADIRHLFAYVPQGNTIMSGTIAENMRIAREDATDEEIMEALKLSCAWDFVSRKEGTINAVVGERGRGLSEGQAQRISIARALLRDAPILLFDEATSALDVTTERQVLRNIVTRRPDRTVIVTTHRPSVLNMCTRVYRVMKTTVTELDEEESSKMAMDF